MRSKILQRKAAPALYGDVYVGTMTKGSETGVAKTADILE